MIAWSSNPHPIHRIWAPLVSGESQICHSSVSETTICGDLRWSHIPEFPHMTGKDGDRLRNSSRTNSSQSVFFFQANCHCHRMANLSSQIKLNTQLDTVCLSLNQFLLSRRCMLVGVCATGSTPWGLDIMGVSPWRTAMELKESLYLCSFCITRFPQIEPHCNYWNPAKCINGWFFMFRISSSKVAPHGFILRPWPRESGFHFTHALVGFWLVWIEWQAAHTRQLQGLNGFP